MAASSRARASPRALRNFAQERLMTRKWGDPEPIKKWRIVRGDTVRIIRGPDRGKEGKVLAVYRKKNRVLVEGLNMGLRVFKQGADRPAGKYKVERPVHYSSVQLLDPESGKPTRVGVKRSPEGGWVRIARKSGAVIPKPPESRMRVAPRRKEAGPEDTLAAEVGKETWDGLAAEMERMKQRRLARKEANDAALIPPPYPASKPIPRETLKRLQTVPREKLAAVYGEERVDEILASQAAPDAEEVQERA